MDEPSQNSRGSLPKFSIALVAICTVFVFAALAVYFYASSGGVELGRSTSIVGRDFLNLYTAGELLRDERMSVLFSGVEYHANIKSKYGDNYPIHNWSYPPVMFWPASFAVLFNYYVSLLLWHLAGIGLIALAVNRLGLSPWWSILIVFSPAGGLNILAGQNGFFTGALIVFAFIFAQSASALSGLSWALLTVKPHLGIIALPYLFLNRQWRVILSGGIFFLLLVGATIATWGLEPWISFFTYTADQQRIVLEEWTGILNYTVPTGFMQGRLLGLSSSNSYLLHAVFAGLAIGLAIRAWQKMEGNDRHALTWYVVTTFLVLPYSFLYDMVVVQIVLALWIRDPRNLFGTGELVARFLWLFAWLSPLVSMMIAWLSDVQTIPFVLLLMLWGLGNRSNSEF